MLLHLLPPPMPHAVFDQRPAVHPHRLSDARFPISYQPPFADLLTTKLDLPGLPRDVTPPSDMNVGVQHGRPSGLQMPLHTLPREAAAYLPRQQPELFSVSQPNQLHSSFSNELTQAQYFPPSPSSQRPCNGLAEAAEAAKSVEGPMAPALRIPDTIRTPQSSLAQLAAEVTCLFWFEDASTLQRILDPVPHVPAPLEPDATPSIGFRKWVSMILSTTQVTPNVILLALLFVYRLKKVNPTVKGRPGSEFRLLTVAFMLGNKFLDDNTYTNKTWAEVSGISVQEVHLMEVEFLSNMRYGLYCSEHDWKEWHGILGMFGTYIYQAAKLKEKASLASGLPPTVQIPSPPTSSHASPLYPSANSPLNATGTNTPLLLPQYSSTAVSPIGQLPELNLRPCVRKRSYDEEAEEPPAKRLHRMVSQPVFQPPVTAPAHIQLPNPNPHVNMHPQLPRLASLSIQTNVCSPASQPQLAAPQLPPPGRSAMGLVYSQQQASQPPSSGPSMVTTPSQGYVSAYSDSGSRQLSPFPVGSDGSSPLSASYAPNRLSPSFFLQQRCSPYRPVRPVNHLLAQPPSVATYSAPRNVPLDQMQYRSLARPLAETRTGHLPYLSYQAWPQSHQLNQWPAVSQH